jgi:hypothetical protein
VAASDRFRVKTSIAVSKVYDDEALVLNTATGRYFDLEGTAPDVWVLLADGTTAAEAAAALSARYDVDAATAEPQVEALLEQLHAEDLIEPCDGPPSPAPVAGLRARYVPPALTGFSDMEELLAADPPLPSDYTPVWEGRQGS